MRILMILLPDAGRLEGFAEPYYALRDAGAELVLASPEGGYPWAGPRDGAPAPTPALRRLHQDGEAREALGDTLRLDQLHPGDFDAGFCLGAAGAPWRATDPQAAGALVARLLAAGRPVAVIPAPRDLAPHGAGEGLLIAGDHLASPLQAAQALLGALPR